jgi:polysaccharide biosynthesis transport protein
VVSSALQPHRSPPPSPAPAPEPPLLAEGMRYASAALRHKWIVLGATVLATAVGVGVSLTLSPEYLARATVWIQVPTRQVREQGSPIWSGQLPISTGWTDLLRTNVVLEEVVRERQLYLAPRTAGDSDVLAGFRAAEKIRAGTYVLVVDAKGHGFVLRDKRKKELQRGTTGDPVGSALGFLWTPPADRLTAGRRVEFTVESPYEAARRLGKNLKTHLDVDGNFLRLELGGSNPVEVTEVVNAVAQRFVAAAADLKRQNLTELSHILGEQLERARADLASAETALKQFRMSAVTEYTEGTATIAPNMQYPRDPVFAGLFDMKVSREELRRDRAAIDRILAQASESALAVDALTMIGSVQRSTEFAQALRDLTTKQAELRAIQTRYTDVSPTVQRIAADVRTLERQRIPALATHLSRELALRENELSQRIGAASTGLRRIPPLAVEEARLAREVALRDQGVTNLTARYQEARLAEVSSIADVRLVDPAVQPEEPAARWGAILIALGFLGGLTAGIAGAVVIDQADHRVQYPEHVTETLGLNILGAVPHIERSGNGREAAGTLETVEALRAVRLNLLHAHGTGPTMVTVTSPGHSDGKSLIASNLAVAFADAGYRTLLIDGDVRKGVLHRTLKAPRRPGLVDALMGTVPVAQAIQPTAYRTLSFLPSGTRTHAAPVLVSSAPLPRLMAELRPNYDAVIVDSPPLAAGVDALALGTATGAMLLVLRTGVSDREMAYTKLETLAHLPIRVLGAVLNDVRGGRYRYYSYYLEGYEARDEQPTSRLMRAPE